MLREKIASCEYGIVYGFLLAEFEVEAVTHLILANETDADASARYL